MPRMTAKYKSALAEAKSLKLKASSGIDQEKLYALLAEQNRMWDSAQQVWIDLVNEPAEEPCAVVMVRVWSDGEIVEEVADDVEESFHRRGYTKVERSVPYRCRPPKQLESRVYLKFLPPSKKGAQHGKNSD